MVEWVQFYDNGQNFYGNGRIAQFYDNGSILYGNGGIAPLLV